MLEVNISNITCNVLAVVPIFLAIPVQYDRDPNQCIGIEYVSLADFIKLIRSPCYARPCVITIAETLRGICGSWKSCAFCGLDAPLSGLWYALIEKTRIAPASIFFNTCCDKQIFRFSRMSEFFRIRVVKTYRNKIMNSNDVYYI